MKLDNKSIKAELLKTDKFSSVRFGLSPGYKTKWSVYLRPKSDTKGVHFHISYVDGGFKSQDNFTLPNRSYYDNWVNIKLKLAKTPMDAIREVAQLLNDGYKISKL